MIVCHVLPSLAKAGAGCISVQVRICAGGTGKPVFLPRPVLLVFGDKDYAVLSTISVSHLYNLRKSTTYCRQRRHFEKTKAKPSSIGERRKPEPNGQPGYIRIDTVHQGDLDKQKGVYHINAVDEVTQFEVIGSVEKISEQYLIPLLEKMLETFPFVVLGFHADNGSEYINKKVATLLEKLLIEFTKKMATAIAVL